MAQSGGAEGLMHLPALESALAQPQMTFGGEELYPTFVDKAAVLGYALIKNHPFLDRNK
jgi:death-on-curing protein